MTRKAAGRRSAGLRESHSGLDWALAAWILATGLLCVAAMAMELLGFQPLGLLTGSRLVYLVVIVACIAGGALGLTRRLRSGTDGE